MSINENNGATSANNETFSEPKKSFWQRTKEAFSNFFSIATLRKFWQFLFVLVMSLFAGTALGLATLVVMHYAGPVAAVVAYMVMLFAAWILVSRNIEILYRAEAWFVHQFDKAVMWWIIRRETKAAEAELNKAEKNDGLGDMPAAA